MATRRINYINRAGLLVHVEAPDAIDATQPWSSLSLGTSPPTFLVASRDPDTGLLERSVWGEDDVSGQVRAYVIGRPIPSTATQQRFLNKNSADPSSPVVKSVNVVSVKFVDETGAAIVGAPIGWADITEDNPGSVSVTSSVTDANGVASVSWTIGRVAGSVNTLRGTSLQTGAVQDFNCTPIAGAAAKIVAISPTVQTQLVSTGVPVKPKVLITDDEDNPKSGTTVTFAVTAGAGAAGGLTPASDASGFAEVGSWATGASAGLNRMTATAGGLIGSPQTFDCSGTSPAVSLSLQINAGGVQTAVVVGVASAALQVKVLNGATPVQGQRVNYSILSGPAGAALSAAFGDTDAGGLCGPTVTPGNLIGTILIQAEAVDNLGVALIGSPVQFSVTSVAGASHHMVFEAAPPSNVPDATSFQHKVRIVDQFGNFKTGLNNTAVTVAKLSGAAVLTGSLSTTTGGAGVATFTNTLTGNGLTCVLRYSTAGLPDLDSASILVGTPFAHHTGFISQPPNGVSGLALAPFDVGIYDINNQIMTGAVNNVQVDLEVPAGATISGNIVQAVSGIAHFDACTITLP